MANKKTKDTLPVSPPELSDKIVVSCDEVGRGCLFGRCYVAAVILTYGYVPPAGIVIKDSKQMTEDQRNKAAQQIKKDAIDWAVCYQDAKYIDQRNILNAVIDSWHTSIDSLDTKFDHILIDGNQFRPYTTKDGQNVQHTCVVKGDATYLGIAAASILAKVERDQWVYEMCDMYPYLDEQYDLRKNKGYLGSPKHMEGLQKYGRSQWHRKSYKVKALGEK